MPLAWTKSSPASCAFSVNHSAGAGAAGGAEDVHAAKKKNARHAARALRLESTVNESLVVALAEMTVEHFFRELHALELEQLEVLLEVLVEHEVDLPRTREELRIRDGRLVVDVVGVHQAEALDDVRRIGGVVARAIEPR